jgi:hypothetical protein
MLSFLKFFSYPSKFFALEFSRKTKRLKKKMVPYPALQNMESFNQQNNKRLVFFGKIY